MGIGSARGEGRAVQAAEKAINSPLLEASMDGAHGVLLSIAGGSDLGLFEINEAASLVQEAAHPDANIIFGTVIDDSLGDEVRVTVIAAGFEAGTPTHKKLEPTAFGSPRPRGTARRPRRRPRRPTPATPRSQAGTPRRRQRPSGPPPARRQPRRRRGRPRSRAGWCPGSACRPCCPSRRPPPRLPPAPRRPVGPARGAAGADAGGSRARTRAALLVAAEGRGPVRPRRRRRRALVHEALTVHGASAGSSPPGRAAARRARSPGSTSRPASATTRRRRGQPAQAGRGAGRARAVVFLDQVHGTGVAVVDAAPGPGDPDRRDADAAVTALPGVGAGRADRRLRPVLLADPRAGVVGVAHAGRVGAAAGVLPRDA